MKKVTMVTIVPRSLAEKLNEHQRIVDYNTLPQINESILGEIRSFMTEKVGYSELPMACLRQPSGNINAGLDVSNVINYLPVNNNESIFFQLEMEADMIVSVNFKELLEYSCEAGEAETKEELDFVLSCFHDVLQIGIAEEDCNDAISFIPFLDYSKCKFYAKFDKDFQTEGFNIAGLKRIKLRELKSFIA